MPVERGFIWGVVENLKELRSPQMVHELRIQTEVLAQSETIRVVFVVLAELLTLLEKIQ